MNELEYKNEFVALLMGRSILAQAHEDRNVKFIPDLSFSGKGTSGWIEVKYCDRVPKTLNDIEHWTRGQEQWLIQDGIAGTGNNFLLVGTPRVHTLIRYDSLVNSRHADFESVADNLAEVWELSAGRVADYLARTVGQRRRRG